MMRGGETGFGVLGKGGEVDITLATHQHGLGKAGWR